LTCTLPAREGLPPGVGAGGTTQGFGERRERRDRRRVPVLAKGEIAAPRLGRAPRATSALPPAGDEDKSGLRGRCGG